MLNMYQRFNSHEIPHASVRARFGAHEQIVEADEEGFFWIEMELTDPLPTDTVWHTLELELRGLSRSGRITRHRTVFVPPTNAQFGVISDLDDGPSDGCAASAEVGAQCFFAQFAIPPTVCRGGGVLHGASTGNAWQL